MPPEPGMEPLFNPPTDCGFPTHPNAEPLFDSEVFTASDGEAAIRMTRRPANDPLFDSRARGVAVTSEELTEAVHWLMDSVDPDVTALVTGVCDRLNVTDLVEWATTHPTAVYELYTAARVLTEDAPIEQTQSFTSRRPDP